LQKDVIVHETSGWDMGHACGTGNPQRRVRVRSCSHALQAHAVLTDHFMKKENVLFPMAENMLSAEEKEELVRVIGLS
jgi:iron-sulfur cluster repair protein YtfE (RIC family)